MQKLIEILLIIFPSLKVYTVVDDRFLGRYVEKAKPEDSPLFLTKVGAEKYRDNLTLQEWKISVKGCDPKFVELAEALSKAGKINSYPEYFTVARTGKLPEQKAEQMENI